MNSSPWRLEEVNSGDEQYPVESRFDVHHTPPDEQDPRFDRSALTQVRFLRFAVRHTPPDQQDPVSTVGGPREVRFLHFAVRHTPPVLGNVAEIQKFSYVTPRSIYGETSNE